MISAATNVYTDLMDKNVFESAFNRCQVSVYIIVQELSPFDKRRYLVYIAV